MEFTRWRRGVLALLVLGLAGCAAPKEEARSRFVVLVGDVVDVLGNPVAGAEVAVAGKAPNAAIGTRNYTGSTGPFMTDANGRFSIPAVQLIPSDPVVLNLRVSGLGYAPAYVQAVPARDMTVGGTSLRAGVATPDIVVAEPLPAQVRAVLTPLPGSAAGVGASSE
ncbi:MAG: carboxypeptidase-like regulatory domain-containing protein [Armatimonadota bacterium]|nr:carboxypeptidase-like regulatory domain-containing protein [Armatimonadota bacterium]